MKKPTPQQLHKILDLVGQDHLVRMSKGISLPVKAAHGWVDRDYLDIVEMSARIISSIPMNYMEEALKILELEDFSVGSPEQIFEEMKKRYG